MTDKFNNQSGESLNQGNQTKYSNLIYPKKNLNELTDEELIALFKKCNYSTSEISHRLGKFEDYARRIYKHRGIDCNKIKEDFKKSKIIDYSNNPNRCLHCGNPLDWEHRNNKYCCQSCAASENNKNRTKKFLKKKII